MSVTAPDEAVANYLAAHGFGTIGTDLFRGGVRPADPGAGIPHAAIFVLATGGPPPDPFLPANGSQTSLYQSNVQVRVRGDSDDMAATTVQAQAVLDALHLAVLTMTSANFIACKSLSASPLPMGRDLTEHPEYSVNVTVWFER